MPEMSESESIDINDPDFDARKWNINGLIRIQTRYDVDLPPTRQKKEYYVNLTMEHLQYMRKRFKDDLKKSAKKPPSKGVFAVPTTPASRLKLLIRTAKDQGKISTSTPVVSFKKRAVVDSENDSTAVFSDNNPFQTPEGSKPKRLTKQKFTHSKIEVPEQMDKVDTVFTRSCTSRLSRNTIKII